MKDRDRLSDLGPARNGNRAPRGAQRLVEGRQRIGDRHGDDGSLREGDPVRKAVRKLADIASAKQDELRAGREKRSRPREPEPRGLDVGRRRRGKNRRRVRHCGAQVRIVPGLYPSGWQAGLGETRESRGAYRRTASRACCSANCLKRVFSAADRLTTWAFIGGYRQPPPRNRGSRCVRVRARVRDRRSRQSGLWTSRARHPV